MDLKVVKVRIIGSRKACERIQELLTSQLPRVALKGQVRKTERDPERDPYSSTFGKAEAVYYLKLIEAWIYSEKLA